MIMIIYIAVRCFMTPVASYDVVWRAQSFFWLAFGFIFAVVMLSRSVLRCLTRLRNLRQS